MRSAYAPAEHPCTYPQRTHTRKSCVHAVHPCTYPQCTHTRSTQTRSRIAFALAAYLWTERPACVVHTHPQSTRARIHGAPTPAPAQHMCTYPQCTHTAKHAYTQRTHARIHSAPTPVAHVYTRSRFEPACAMHPHPHAQSTCIHSAPTPKCAAQLSPLHPRTRTRNAPTQRPTHSCRAATCLTVLVGVYVMSMAALEEAFVGELVHNTERTIHRSFQCKHRHTRHWQTGRLDGAHACIFVKP